MLFRETVKGGGIMVATSVLLLDIAGTAL